jgi:cellulose synthase/poly-beta-1,6-N-acetylglucosamine synthase-like glycosyltransferase
MAARVIQVDLAQPLAPLRTSKKYAAYWAMVRFGRSPLGWVRFRRSIVGDVVTPDVLRGLIADQIGPQIVDGVHRAAHLPPAPAHRPPVSVVICTREHPDQLERQLRSMTALDYPEFEVIVVDNAPRTDRTRKVCEQFGGFVRYVVEPHKGLDYARNAGWRAARYPIVAYTDDDACVDRQWLSGLAHGYADPRVACVTGITFPYELESEAQELFEKYGGMQRGFERRVFNPGPWSPHYPVGSGRFGAGVNLSIRRDVLEAIGGFDEALDVGSLARGGGDLDIMTRVIREGWSLVYEPAAIVWHQHRRTMRELRRQMFDYGYGFTAFCAKHASDLEYGNQVWKLLRRWARHWGRKRLMTNLWLAMRLQRRFPVHLILMEIAGGVLGYSAYKRSLRRVNSTARKDRRDGARPAYELVPGASSPAGNLGRSAA